MFWDPTAYAVYYQYHRSIVELGRATMRLKHVAYSSSFPDLQVTQAIGVSIPQ